MYPPKLLNSLAAVILISILSTGCAKYDKEGDLPQGSVAITFDDHFVDNWYKYLPLLDSFNAKATFFVDAYSKLTDAQKNKLKIIQQHGHEIAYHTVNHYDLLKYLGKHSMQELIGKEINPGLEAMHKDGFYPTTFAYPFGSHNYQLDIELTKMFKSVRALNGSSNYAKSLVRADCNKYLFGLGMDNSSNHPDKLYYRMLDGVKNTSSCLVLVGHMIGENNSKFQVPSDRLRSILQKARELNLKFYTISEISN
ncbi:MAG: polysaccharide deacetylase family protein [Chitinophagaceae bacterium]|nr:polysaccharide deacetylase family protein [Chitinophagaceae bacterium]